MTPSCDLPLTHHARARMDGRRIRPEAVAAVLALSLIHISEPTRPY